MKTDTQLQRDVLAELNWEPSVNAAQIGVEVADGIVTLAGHVNSYAEKGHAEKAAQRVAGVMALTVELEVKLPGPSERTDVDIARAAENVLVWMTYVPKDAVKVMVESGWLTLSGNVDWQYQRQGCIEAVRYLMGVRGVTNLIEIKPKLSMSMVKGDIEAALHRRAKSDAKSITVAIDGTDVTLSGHVHSWSDRELAKHSAWSTPGVRNVVDNLTIMV
ncbi:MAG: BON domain-containing protein [Pseudomonadota bacterium]